jgi:hypothetical protein
MRSATAIILFASVVQAHSSDEQDTMDKMVEMLKDENNMDMLVEKLADKLFGPALMKGAAPAAVARAEPSVGAGRRAMLFGAMGMALPGAARAGPTPKPEEVPKFALPQRLAQREVKIEKRQQAAKKGLKVWGNPYGDGGSTPENPYAVVAFPDVGDSIPTTEYKLQDKPKSGYVPGPKYALTKNDRYELLANGLKAEITEATDQTAVLKPQLLEDQTSVVGISAVMLISLLVGSGITLAVARARRSPVSLSTSLLA